MSEAQRAANYLASQKRQAAARRDRERRLKGNPVARKALGVRWAPLSRKGVDPLPPSNLPPAVQLGRPAFLQGEGPPPDDIPGAYVGATYLDTLTGDLYERE